jgi:two-component system LytT family response regulator
MEIYDIPVRVLIVDDESAGRIALRGLLEITCPQIEEINVCSSVDEAVAFIDVNKPDLVFLDVEMPGKNGFELLNAVDEIDFYVIFVTGYDHYAIQAIKLNALDYLLKPVRPQDLINCIQKVSQLTRKKQRMLHSALGKNFYKPDKLAIPIRNGFSFVDLKEVVRCEADANYSIIFLESGLKITSSKTLGEYESILSEFGFLRTHKSHLINLYYVKNYSKGEGGVITLKDGTEIPVSKKKRQDFLIRINSPN